MCMLWKSNFNKMMLRQKYTILRKVNNYTKNILKEINQNSHEEENQLLEVITDLHILSEVVFF